MNTNKAIIHFGAQVRFSVLSEHLIRAEYAADGNFLDGPTLAIAQRRFQEARIEVLESDEKIEIRTPHLQLTYSGKGERFSGANLQIQYDCEGNRGAWKFGDANTGALPGTLRTLDKMDGPTKIEMKVVDGERQQVRSTPEFIPGYISRSGYTVYDDSKTIPLTNRNGAGEPWVAPRRDSGDQDIYFAAYGKDYYLGLSTMALIMGKQPIPPRFAMGLWFSRYWEFTDRDLESIVRTHDRLNIPLDVLVIDMDWHKPGWTGYSWNPTYFPDPDDTLAFLQDQNIHITMNLHPADGVASHEDQYSVMCLEMGMDPSLKETVAFDCTDPQFMDAYFRLLHHPFEDQGVRFWWMDWQQGQSCDLEGLDPLPWLNELHWRDLARRFPRRRPMIFSRFGGPGAGRYVIGFSGDTHITWNSLAFQPNFTATAANIGYGYWSHDIGGHVEGDDTDPELYTRWVQFGAYSPVLRLHECKNLEDHRFLWNYRRPYQDVLIESARNRYRMLPYIMSELNYCWVADTSLCMPMYYEYPEVEAAYEAKDQYFFGRQMIVAPITEAANEMSSLASKRLWIPEGEWIDYANGRVHVGPMWIEESYPLEEVPLLVRKGAIWVEQTDQMRAGRGSFEHPVIVLAGEADSRYLWTEDDGDSTDYQNDQVAGILIQQTVSDKYTRIEFQRQGESKHDGFLAKRNFSLRLPFRAVPDSIQFGETLIEYKKRGGGQSWRYDGNRMEIVIDLGKVNLDELSSIEIRTSAENAAVDASLYVYRHARLNLAWRQVQCAAMGGKLAPHKHAISWLAQTGSRITHFPDQFADEIRSFESKWLGFSEDFTDFHRFVQENKDVPNELVYPRQSRVLTILQATE